MESPRFEPLFHADRLHVVNPRGDVGILTLWSTVQSAQRALADADPVALDPEASRVAVISNLYGDGMYAMFCNLLYNPQIRHIIAFGQSLGLSSCREITAFLEHGLEDSTILGRTVKRVRGESRIFPADPDFVESRLRETLTFRQFGMLGDEDVRRELPAYLASLPVTAASELPERIRVKATSLDDQEHVFRPSEAMAHQVVRRRPLDCWEELIVRVERFGEPVQLRKGTRLELLNVKAVVTEPALDAAEDLDKYGFSLPQFLRYQEQILEPELPAGISYTYGNRLRGHFGLGGAGSDTLASVIRALQRDPETRRGYVSLWDNEADLADGTHAASGDIPCLTTLFFRRTAGRLSLSATYRSHNLLTAWLENLYGLMALQSHVAEAVDMPIGPISVTSHSLGIDPSSARYVLASSLSDGWKRDGEQDRRTGRPVLRQDPNGYFIVRVDETDSCIVAEHRFDGFLIKEYRAARAAVLEREIITDMGVSLVSHAMWLGRELAAREQELNAIKAGRTSTVRGPRRPRADA